VRGTKSWADSILDLAVRRYEIVDGLVEYDERKIPIGLRGENLQIRMAFDARGPRYFGELSSRPVRMIASGIGPLDIDVSTAFALNRSRIEVTRMRLATRQSRADLAGALEDPRAPHGTFTVKATAPVRDAVALFDLPVRPSGTTAFDGRLSVSFVKGFDFGLIGRVDARGLSYTRDRLKIDGASVRANLNLTRDKLTLRALTASALGSTLKGEADLANWRDFHLEGVFDGLSVREAANVATDRAIPWNGALAGSVTVDAVVGKPTAKVQANVGITPAPEGTPIEGQLDVSYAQESGELQLGNSYVATPATRVDLSGTLGRTLQVHARSTNLDDLLPALAMARSDAPKEMPLKLASGGSATFTGMVSGPLEDPRLMGQVVVTDASVEGHAFSRFTSDVEASSQRVRLQRLQLARGATEVQGSVEIAPSGGKFEDGVIFAQLNVRNASLAELSKEAGVTTPIAGTAVADVRLFGALRRPEAAVAMQVEKPAAFGEQADRLRLNLRYAPTSIEVSRGEVDAGPGKLSIQGGFQHRENDWTGGDLRFELTAQGVPISRSQTLAKLQPALDGNLDAKISGAGRLANKNQLSVTAVNGEVAAHAVTWDRQPLGDVTLTAETHAMDLALRATAQVRDATVQAQGSFRLEGDMPGTVKIQIPRVSLATLRGIVMIAGTPEDRNTPPPFEGFIEGGANLTLALRKPQDLRGELTIDTMQFNTRSTQALRLGVQTQDVVLRNAKPVVVDLSAKEARIVSAQFTARDTSLAVSGSVRLDPKTGADLSVRGSVNLAILQLLSPDLLARGAATVQAAVRGSLANPQLNGRMELKAASLYLTDLPNGVDNAEGVVLFDRNRATIERLTAETGGGKVSFGGFIEFSSILIYRLQAEAQNVRVRYADIGVTLNTRLALNGTSDASTVSGTITLNRASVDPRADLGQLLALAARPAPAPPQSDYLRGMQFDVRIESGPNLQLQTSLTRDVETEVDLHLRGTPLRPVLLGTISVDQGEVEVFGNRYTIDRGDIRFLNPVRVEPTFDINLETRARGITVNIFVSGTTERMTWNYSSDPPLQSREIIALLAVGRAPTGATGFTSNPSTAGLSSFADAGGGLIGQAVSAQLSSRLQRFFGASRVKIDPTVTGVDYLPQARLTLEQQVSKDITLTYITNLNRTQEQIVQVQWDLNQRWSAIAVRGASGLFGIDFQYKKRFK
jgi:translocation and assembly module TamB